MFVACDMNVLITDLPTDAAVQFEWMFKCEGLNPLCPGRECSCTQEGQVGLLEWAHMEHS